jgi:hypothetical protein
MAGVVLAMPIVAMAASLLGERAARRLPHLQQRSLETAHAPRMAELPALDRASVIVAGKIHTQFLSIKYMY